MEFKRLTIAIITCLLIFGPGAVESSSDRKQFGEVRLIALSPDAIINEYSTPVIASGGDVGFVSSVTTGSLISFSVSSGKILSSVNFGKFAGLVSMIEIGKKRLIALPTADGPDQARPAIVNIINVTSAERPERVALIELPAGAQIGPDTRALFTTDGRFGVIAAGIDQPTLFSFSIESGKIISSLKLPGWPSAIAVYEEKKNNKEHLVAVSSVEANILNLINLDSLGRLSAGKDFNPVGMRLDISNNPAFSADGQIVYIAVFNGEHIFSIDTQKGTVLGMIKLPSAPQRITVIKEQSGIDLVGVTLTARSSDKKAGGIIILASNKGQLTVRTEFTLPDNAQLSRANNIVFDSDIAEAFIGSADGTLFAFNTKTGEIGDHKTIGKELRGLELSKAARTLIGVRSTPKNDEIAIIGLDQASAGRIEMQTTPHAPEIRRVRSGPAQVHLVIEGANFSRDAIVEFVKAGNVVSRQTPINVTDNRLAIIVPVKKVEALGKFELRVVSSDKAQSNVVMIDPSVLLAGGDADAAPVKSDPPLKTATVIVGPPPKIATELQSVRTELADGVFRVIVDANGEARFNDFTLAGPPRIVVDFEGLSNAFGNRVIQVGKGLIKRVRVGKPTPGVVRVVIDTKKSVPYRVTREAGSIIIVVGDNQ